MISQWRGMGRWLTGEEYLVTFADSGIEAWRLLTAYLHEMTQKNFLDLHFCTVETLTASEDGYSIVHIVNRKTLVEMRSSCVRDR